MSEFDINELRKDIKRKTSELQPEKMFQARDVNEVLEMFDFNVSSQQLKKLRDSKLINPTQDSKGYYLYSREDLRELLLIQTLRGKHGVQLAKIGGLLLTDLKNQINEEDPKAPPSAGLPPDQIYRTNLFWRSYIMMVTLAFLFEGEIPRNARILIRKRQNVTKTRKKGGPWVKAVKCDFLDVVEDLRESKNDLELTLISVEDREILHVELDWENWKECQNEGCHWFAVHGFSANTEAEYELILGIPEEGYGLWNSLEHRGVNSQKEMVLLKLLECFFMESEKQNISPDKIAALSTRLHVLVQLIPELSQAWRYCVVLVPDGSNQDQLVIAEASDDLELPDDSQVPLGELLCGWVYDRRQFVIVDRTIGKNDPRIFYQSEENASAAAAFPTQTKSAKPNGVLYVGLRNNVEREEPVFSEVDIKMLRILSGIIGELIELRDLRVWVAETGRQTILEKNFHAHSWEEYRQDLKSAIQRLKKVPPTQMQNNLHIVTFSLQNYVQIKKLSARIADWTVNHLQMSAYNFFLKKGYDGAKIYRYSPSKFVMFQESYSQSDEGEHKLRKKLSELLNSVNLFFEQEREKIQPRCELWSMPFRYDGILQKVEDEDIGEKGVVKELVFQTKQQFKILHHIFQAHEYEAEASWQYAKSEYELAQTLDRENNYLRRHIAKMNTELRNYNQAKELWLRITLDNQHPSHYRRLAYNYSCNNELDEAEDMCRRALNMDPEDARSYVMMGNIYCYQGKYEDAINSYHQAISCDSEQQVDYLRQIVEAHYEAGEYQDALTVCSQAHALDPDNPDLRYWIPKIEQKLGK